MTAMPNGRPSGQARDDVFGPEAQKVAIIGDGRIGRAFFQMTGPRGRLVARGERVTLLQDEDESFPIIVSTHCSHLEAVLSQTCSHRWKDLVFLQNGMLQPWLCLHGLLNNTQVLLFMSALPENPLEHKGNMQIRPGGRDSLVWGRWGGAIKEIMHAGGLPCSAVSHEKYLEVMVEKLLWSSIFWLLSAGLGGLSVGAIVNKHLPYVEELTIELLPLAESYLKSATCQTGEMMGRPADFSFPKGPEMVTRLCHYSNAIYDSVPSKSMALSEFHWRNGWFLSQKVTDRHVHWLRQAGVSPTFWQETWE